MCQAIVQTLIQIKMQWFWLKEIDFKILSAKWQPFCLGLSWYHQGSFCIWLSKVSANERRHYKCNVFSHWLRPCSAIDRKWAQIVQTIVYHHFELCIHVIFSWSIVILDNVYFILYLHCLYVWSWCWTLTHRSMTPDRTGLPEISIGQKWEAIITGLNHFINFKYRVFIEMATLVQ